MSNLGFSSGFAYKRVYFVDWPVLVGYRAEHAATVDSFADTQWGADHMAWCEGARLRGALGAVAGSAAPLRARPWFEPGVWGGHWSQRLLGSPDDGSDGNLAWSFELISPENGLVFRDAGAGTLMECSWDWLMALEGRALMGRSADRFGSMFPVRFNFLDTIGGGNLSVQVHPGDDQIAREFGEPFAQDESYYILEAGEGGAETFLGFQGGIDPAAFRAALEASERSGAAMAITDYVLSHPSAKHDYFHIPHGTVHSSGRNQVVLEISSTPYIFTFKAYDWARKGKAGGAPRPLNINRAFVAFDFDRQGERRVTEQHRAVRGMLVADGVEHLATHPRQFYDVHRARVAPGAEVVLPGFPHSASVMAVVDGRAGAVVNGVRHAYAETFVVPAGAASITLATPPGATEDALVLRCFVKESHIVPERLSGLVDEREMVNKNVIALDVGGSSIKSAICASDGRVMGRVRQTVINATATDKEDPLTTLAECVGRHLDEIEGVLGRTVAGSVAGVAIAFPGPFDYEKGVCQIPQFLLKYFALFGVDVGAEIRARLGDRLPADCPIRFRNDAEASILGEALFGSMQSEPVVLGLTLGTGLGSCAVEHGAASEVFLNMAKVGEDIGDNVFSTRGVIARLVAAGAAADVTVAEGCRLAKEGDEALRAAWAEWGADLGALVARSGVDAPAVVLLGGICGGWDLFGDAMKAAVGPNVTVALGSRPSGESACLGVAELIFRHR